MMETGILLDLRSIEILSELNVISLKQYILKKYPHEDSNKRSLVFADAVKRIVGSKIPECDAASKENLKMRIIRNALKKPAFSVDCGDVFVSALELKWRENELLDSLSKWIKSVLSEEIPSEKLKKLVYEVYFALDANPDLSIETAIQNIYEAVRQAEESFELIETEESLYSEISDSEEVGTIADTIEISRIEEIESINDISKIDENIETEEEYLIDETVEISRIDEIEVINDISKIDESIETEEADLIDETIEISRIDEIMEIRKIIQINEKRLSISGTRRKFIDIFKLIKDLLKHIKELPMLNKDLLTPVKDLLKRNKDLLTPIKDLLKIIKALLKPIEINKISVIFTCLICFMILSSGWVYLEKSTNVEIEKPVVAEIEKLVVVGIEKPKVNEIAQNFMKTKVRENFIKKLNMRATAYDLSYESCKKDRDHPEYGITYSGRKAVLGRTVAVDPETIPLDSELYIVFPKEFSHLNGVYVAEDIGSAVKGDIIDIFFGEDKVGEKVIAQKVKEFGARKVEVYVLK